jgi:hypothetical protein
MYDTGRYNQSRGGCHIGGYLVITDVPVCIVSSSYQDLPLLITLLLSSLLGHFYPSSVKFKRIQRIKRTFFSKGFFFS